MKTWQALSLGTRKRPRQSGGFNLAYDEDGRQVHSKMAAGGTLSCSLPLGAVSYFSFNFDVTCHPDSQNSGCLCKGSMLCLQCCIRRVSEIVQPLHFCSSRCCSLVLVFLEHSSFCSRSNDRAIPTQPLWNVDQTVLTRERHEVVKVPAATSLSREITRFSTLTAIKCCRSLVRRLASSQAVHVVDAFPLTSATSI